ncbi:MAG: hypothetical protein AAF216_01415 [Pseudomonadota bacterium]
MASFTDMNGLWSGWFRYSLLTDRVPFTAWIDDTASILTGSILEPNTFSSAEIDDLQALVSGTRVGSAVTFIKTYVPGQAAHEHPISYSGQVTDDFEHVAGTWSFSEAILGTGPFEMRRTSKGISEGILRDVMASVGAL